MSSSVPIIKSVTHRTRVTLPFFFVPDYSPTTSRRLIDLVSFTPVTIYSEVGIVGTDGRTLYKPELEHPLLLVTFTFLMSVLPSSRTSVDLYSF